MLLLSLTFLASTVFLSIATAQCDTYYYKNYTANFDSVTTGAGPPDNYASINWYNWEVTNQVALSPHSKPSYIVATDSNLGYLEQGNGKAAGGQVLFGLQSFYFGCSTSFDGDSFLPVGCTVTVTTKTITNEIPIKAYNFTFLPHRHKGYPSFKMQQMETGGIFGEYMYFTLSGGTGATSVFLDNLVISQLKCN